MDVDWTIMCGLLVLPALVAAALVWIQIQDFRVRSWRQASGRIVSSKPVARTIRKVEHRTSGSTGHTDFESYETLETRNFAELAYEFAVAGKTYTGSRIDLGVDSGNFEVAEKLKRYPEGKTVAVFYDPGDPAQCILERDDPKNIRNGWLVVVLLVVLIVGGVFGVDRIADLVRGVIPHPKRTPLVVVLGVFALFLLLFARMVGQQRRAMRTWTRTTGRIVESAVAATTHTHDKPNSMRGETTQTIYVPRIVYSYEAAGNLFQGDNIGATWSGSTPASAEKYVARYPVGAPVTVFFDPTNATQSTLKPGTGYLEVVLWALAGLLVAAAVAVGDMVPDSIMP